VSGPGATPTSAATSDIDTEALKKQLGDALGDEIRKKKVQMRVGPDGLVVSLREIGFFDSGEAKLLPEAKPTITRLAKVLEQRDFEIRVEGHTDNVPIHTARFNSNWELSTERATEVVSMLVDEYGFDPRDVSVAGYAEYRPVVSNDTEEGRKANRRIDLVVIGIRKPPTAQPISGVKSK
jgi:chemotaxis protein MotB